MTGLTPMQRMSGYLALIHLQRAKLILRRMRPKLERKNV